MAITREVLATIFQTLDKNNKCARRRAPPRRAPPAARARAPRLRAGSAVCRGRAGTAGARGAMAACPPPGVRTGLTSRPHARARARSRAPLPVPALGAGVRSLSPPPAARFVARSNLLEKKEFFDGYKLINPEADPLTMETKWKAVSAGRENVTLENLAAHWGIKLGTEEVDTDGMSEDQVLEVLALRGLVTTIRDEEKKKAEEARAVKEAEALLAKVRLRRVRVRVRVLG